jgi:hypothetical protein
MKKNMKKNYIWKNITVKKDAETLIYEQIITTIHINNL